MLKPLMEKLENGTVTSLEEYCNEMAKLPLRYQPGDNLNYSMGHDIVARVIEVVSGKTLDNFFETEIFSPLGMHDTSYSVPKRKAYRFAALYGDAKRAGRMAAIKG